MANRAFGFRFVDHMFGFVTQAEADAFASALDGQRFFVRGALRIDAPKGAVLRGVARVNDDPEAHPACPFAVDVTSEKIQ